MFSFEELKPRPIMKNGTNSIVSLFNYFIIPSSVSVEMKVRARFIFWYEKAKARGL